MTQATTEYALAESVTATADATGSASAVLGPSRPNEVWHVTNSATNGNSTTTPKLTVYRGGINPANTADGSNAANLDASDTVFNLRSGEYLTVQWTRCSNGAQMTYTVQGTRVVKGRRGY